ncbi:MAG: site-specific integrase [Anaerolineae bacterium]|nr:site-specific integrase [Anaerolineae bacterium]
MALRRTELIRILWGDIEFDHDVPDTLLRLGDNGKEVKVNIPAEMRTLIVDWKSRITGQSRATPSDDSPLLRRVWKGGRIDESGITADAVWRITQDAGYDAGLGSVTPDDLRRSRTYHLYQSGVSIKEISQLLGHSSQLVTTAYIEEIEKNM